MGCSKLALFGIFFARFARCSELPVLELLLECFGYPIILYPAHPRPRLGYRN